MKKKMMMKKKERKKNKKKRRCMRIVTLRILRLRSDSAA